MLLERLQKQTGLSTRQIHHLSESASKRYKVYTIPKKDGGRRTIEQPSREVKTLQRWVVQRLIRSLDIHQSATAYRKGSGILSNAMRHVATRFTLRIDFKDFFPSFSSENVRKFLDFQNVERNLDLTLEDISFVTNIVSRNGRLTIGAPSSPILTNAMMYSFDEKLSYFCQLNGLVYTRYADDLFISAYRSGELNGVFGIVCRFAEEFPFGSLEINNKKTAYLSRKYHRSITGLVITPSGEISIGRERKREIRALIYRFTNNELNEEQIAYLQGILAFVSDVEIRLISSLERKYGSRVLQRIRSA